MGRVVAGPQQPPEPRWASYLDYDLPRLLDRLAGVAQELAGLHGEAAMVRAAEKGAKVAGFTGSQASSVTARGYDADGNAINLTTECMKLDGEIKSLTEEKDLLLLLIDLERP
jgi:hypothetical protein